ncbi:alpha/beta hydrolase [Streptosporangium subroseum]|uniref:alpha/beta fold hydrolase n=1 Tax=Streptosporangium subroseum TaxID=106412 RepID=UPI003418D5C4
MYTDSSPTACATMPTMPAVPVVSRMPRPSLAAQAPEPTRLTVAADDGVGLYVEVEGSEDTEITVVFCHGLALSQDCWRFQRAAFAHRARLVFYDQRGHGRSDRGAQGSATIEQLGRDLYRVLAETAPEGPVVLVGHSMGGMTIMALAETHPDLFLDRVVGVGLLSSSAGGLDRLTLGLPLHAAGALYPVLSGVLKVLRGRGRIGDYGRRATGDLIRMLVGRPSVLGLAAGMISATAIEAFADFYPTLAEHDRLAALAALQAMPSVVMVGADDLLTPAEHSTAICAALPPAELVVLPETGHNLVLERPYEVTAYLGRLLTKAENHWKTLRRAA